MSTIGSGDVVVDVKMPKSSPGHWRGCADEKTISPLHLLKPWMIKRTTSNLPTTISPALLQRHHPHLYDQSMLKFANPIIESSKAHCALSYCLFRVYLTSLEACKLSFQANMSFSKQTRRIHGGFTPPSWSTDSKDDHASPQTTITVAAAQMSVFRALVGMPAILDLEMGILVWKRCSCYFSFIWTYFLTASWPEL